MIVEDFLKRNEFKNVFSQFITDDNKSMMTMQYLRDVSLMLALPLKKVVLNIIFKLKDVSEDSFCI